MLERADSRRLDPRHGAAGHPYRSGQAIDVRHDLTRHRHLVRRARCAKIVLHIDYDQRGVASLDCFVGQQLAHPAHDTVLH
jgi:hypothetical protein